MSFKKAFFLTAVFLGLLFWARASLAEVITWAKAYRLPGASSLSSTTNFVFPLEDGFLTTHSWSVNSYGSWVARSDSRGELVWAKFFGSPLGVSTRYAKLLAVQPALGGGF